MNVGESSGADVVGRDTATGTEVAEVERRPVDRAAATARPLDLGDLLAAALGRLGQRLGLQHAGGAQRRSAVAERLAVDVERVVRRAVDARPRAGRQREPAGTRVRRRLRQQSVVGCLGAVLQQVAEAWHDTLLRVLLDGVLAQAIGREEQQLVRAVVTVSAAAPVRRRGVDPDRRGEADQQRGRGDDREPAPTMPRRTNRLTG